MIILVLLPLQAANNTTCFLTIKYLSGVALILLTILRVKFHFKHFDGMNRHFQVELAKYMKLAYYHKELSYHRMTARRAMLINSC